MADKEDTLLGGVEGVKEWQKKEEFPMRKDANPAGKQALLALLLAVPAICNTDQVFPRQPRLQEGVSATCDSQGYFQL